MSCNRDNIFWQRPDGKWVGGFYSFDYNDFGDDDEEFDYEWDVEYDYSSFWCVTTAHDTYEDAYQQYCRYECNPGGSNVLEYVAGDERGEKERAELEEMYVAATKAGKRLSSYPGRISFF